MADADDEVKAALLGGAVDRRTETKQKQIHKSVLPVELNNIVVVPLFLPGNHAFQRNKLLQQQLCCSSFSCDDGICVLALLIAANDSAVGVQSTVD